MTVHLLLREDQNDHGYVDVAVDGVYRSAADAERRLEQERDRARKEHLRVCGDDDDDADWQVYWKIEEHMVE